MEIHHSDLQWLCTVPADLGCAVFWVALGLAVGGGILNSFGGIVGVIGSLALLGTALMK